MPHPAISTSGALSSGIGVNGANGRERRNSSLKRVEDLIGHRQFHPARVGILFILIAHLFGDAAGDRGQALDACTQRLLFERFANLLAQHFLNRAVSLDARSRLARGGYKAGNMRLRQAREIGGTTALVSSKSSSFVRQAAAARPFPIVAIEDVLVDETLPSERMRRIEVPRCPKRPARCSLDAASSRARRAQVRNRSNSIVVTGAATSKARSKGSAARAARPLQPNSTDLVIARATIHSRGVHNRQSWLSTIRPSAGRQSSYGVPMVRRRRL